MRRIRSRDTGPEMLVRRFMHGAGLRFRLHRADLPGRPDLVFPRSRVCVFVHGCFWHGCRKCVDGTRKVKSRTEFWRNKIEGNRTRHTRHARQLRLLGWRVRVVWECQLSQPQTLRKLAADIVRFRETQRPEAGHSGRNAHSRVLR
jgi:DNA mismatch endonuclease (patch repair protein)